MVHSDWGDWLPRAVTEATPDGVALWYLGCNGFILKDGDGTTLLIDPYLGTGDPPRTIRMVPIPFDPTDVAAADAILATHEHTDHVHGPSQAPILAGTGATFHGPEPATAIPAEEGWGDRWDVHDDQFHTVAVGDQFDVGAFTVHVSPAHDPDAAEPVSYVLEHPAGTIVHGGDTKPDPVLEEIGDGFDVDLAIVALGAVGNLFDRSHTERSRTEWYSDENDVVEIANALRTDRLLPSHWDMWKGMTVDPAGLHHHTRSWPHPRRLERAEIGDRIDVPE